MSKHETHPAADLFPLMSDDELQGLIADIQENGQREPATFWNGKLIDGRNRATACERLGLELDACELDPDTDPIKWVLSHNLHRRHLSPSQKSQVALKLKKLLEPEAKERQKASLKKGDKKPVKETLPTRGKQPQSRDKAAAMLGISGKLVDAAEKVEAKGTPELNAAVASGKVSVSRAAKIADAPKEKQAELIELPRHVADEPKLKRAIEQETNKVTVARYLFDSCTETQRAQISVAWNDWWQVSK
jgi:hypothetical protein